MNPPLSIVPTTCKAFRKAVRIGELQIVFYERKVGRSKLRWKIIPGAILGVVRLRMGR